MATCETCGNEYEQTLTVSVAGGEEHVFDSFECAIFQLAPTCAHCGVRVVGHGIQAGEQVYCCAHCARVGGGEEGAIDHV